jgi:exodeoxyribonuclease VII large subunit
MQGVQAEKSIIKSLEQVYNFENLFDVVVIIRGGGSQADLNCFNSYNLASHVAQFPIPVFTGIGHDKDESVVDIVANTKFKTPTAVAEYIISKTAEFENYINGLGESVFEILTDFINQQRNNLNQLISIFSPITKNLLLKENHRLNLLKNDVKNTTSNALKNSELEISNYFYKTHLQTQEIFIAQKNLIILLNQKKYQYSKTFLQSVKYKFRLLESNHRLLNPDTILKRGYTITSFNGKIVKNPEILHTDDLITTLFFKGKIKSKVK